MRFGGSAAPARPNMDIYLPIAEVSLDLFLLLGLGAAIGFLSGVFGVGGGFLLTPLLIFIGVAPAAPRPASAHPTLGAPGAGALPPLGPGHRPFQNGFRLSIPG